jgi:hypothetical protein
MQSSMKYIFNPRNVISYLYFTLTMKVDTVQFIRQVIQVHCAVTDKVTGMILTGSQNS